MLREGDRQYSVTFHARSMSGGGRSVSMEEGERSGGRLFIVDVVVLSPWRMFVTAKSPTKPSLVWRGSLGGLVETTTIGSTVSLIILILIFSRTRTSVDHDEYQVNPICRTEIGSTYYRGTYTLHLKHIQSHSTIKNPTVNNMCYIEPKIMVQLIYFASKQIRCNEYSL